MHSRTQAKFMTCFGGTDRKLPAASSIGFSSFIVVRAVPLTIMMFSVEGCQCHGTEQPAPPLIFRMDASLPGSPCCAAITKHSGVPGIWTIGISAAYIIFVSCACNDIPNPPTEIASIIEQQNLPRNDRITPPALRQSQWIGWRLFPGHLVYPRGDIVYDAARLNLRIFKPMLLLTCWSTSFTV